MHCVAHLPDRLGFPVRAEACVCRVLQHAGESVVIGTLPHGLEPVWSVPADGHVYAVLEEPEVGLTRSTQLEGLP